MLQVAQSSWPLMVSVATRGTRMGNVVMDGEYGWEMDVKRGCSCFGSTRKRRPRGWVMRSRCNVKAREAAKFTSK